MCAVNPAAANQLGAGDQSEMSDTTAGVESTFAALEQESVSLSTSPAAAAAAAVTPITATSSLSSSPDVNNEIKNEEPDTVEL
jgi:hypothetical protein